MSHLLWKYFWENDVDKFRRLLAPAGPNSQAAAAVRSPAVGAAAHHGASPGSVGTSPRATTKSRKPSGYGPALGKARDGSSGLSKAEVNSRDHAGLTLLLRASSSTDPNALAFVQALLDHPQIDLYAQDPESGWNALHRSLYAGNASIARALLAKERDDLVNHAIGAVNKVGQLIKTKDHEGNSPFDLYNSTIAARSLRHTLVQSLMEDDSDYGDGDFEQMLVPSFSALYLVPTLTSTRLGRQNSHMLTSIMPKETSCSCLAATRTSPLELETKMTGNILSGSCSNDQTS